MTTTKNDTKDPTPKQVCLEKLDQVIKGLTACRDKIEAGERLSNEDWLETALPLNDIMDLLGNHKYLED